MGNEHLREDKKQINIMITEKQCEKIEFIKHYMPNMTCEELLGIGIDIAFNEIDKGRALELELKLLEKDLKKVEKSRLALNLEIAKVKSEIG